VISRQAQSLTGLRLFIEPWHGSCNQTAMTNSTHKSKRSEFFHSLSLVWPTNRLRTARIDFWGAIVLVCACGMVAKFAQTLLTH